jgi:CBS domain containing-hemolysin-like protein
MPPTYSLHLLFIFVGLFTSGIATLFSAILQSLGTSRLEELENHDSFLAERLFDAKQFRSRAEQALVFLDFAGIILASVFVGHTVFNESTSWESSLLLTALFFLGIVFVKALLQGLGDRYADQFAVFTATSLGAILIVATPFTAIMQWITKLLSSEQTDEEAREEMEDEITAIMDEAVEEGTIDADEYRIITNIMKFSEVTVEDVMTPRNVVFSANSGLTIEDTVNMQELQMYSRFPVYEGESIDNVTGYVMTKDVLRSALQQKSSLPISSLQREVYFIPENVSLDKALDEFLKRRQHLFVVVDEFGGIEGLITMEDVMETILGAEIVDEVDRVVDMRQLAKQRRDKRIAANILVRDDEQESP